MWTFIESAGRHVVGWRHGPYVSSNGASMMRYYYRQSAIIGFYDDTRVGDESSLVDISQQPGKQADEVGKGKMTHGMELAVARTWQQQTCTEKSRTQMQEAREKRPQQ